MAAGFIEPFDVRYVPEEFDGILMPLGRAPFSQLVNRERVVGGDDGLNGQNGGGIVEPGLQKLFHRFEPVEGVLPPIAEVVIGNAHGLDLLSHAAASAGGPLRE
jgi:hypothetical protein